MAKKNLPHPELLTERLRLRRFEARDLDGLHACFGDADAMRFWNFPASKTKAETARWVRILGKATNPYDFLAWAVAERKSDRCLGLVNYHHREARNERLEIGYILARSHQRKGLMEEALRVRRLGFHCDGGPLRDYWKIGDRYASSMVYSLINGELDIAVSNKRWTASAKSKQSRRSP